MYDLEEIIWQVRISMFEKEKKVIAHQAHIRGLK